MDVSSFLAPTDSLPQATGTDARVAEILDWLAHSPRDDAQQELRLTQERLATFLGLPVSINQFHRILDLFQSRVDSLVTRHKAAVLAGEQPISREARHRLREIDQLLNDLLEGYQRVIKDIEQRLVRNRRRDPGSVAARCLKILRERIELAAYATKPGPARTWSRAHDLYRLSRGESAQTEAATPAAADALRVYREMLAFVAIQPECLSTSEVAETADYLSRFASAVAILEEAPAEPDYHLFWVDTAADTPPMAVARRLPPAGPHILFFSCTRLGTLATEHLRELEAGTAPEQLRLPPQASRSAYRGLLHRLRESWAEPPTRHLQRRQNNYPVSMVIGLPALAELFKADGAAAETPPVWDWTVVNESPSGYALVYAGDDGDDQQGVKTGEVVAIRTESPASWDICIVSRVLKQRASRFEVGLQILATNSSVRAVRVIFRNAPETQEPADGLWLPPIPALRSRDAILIPSGAGASQRFVMAADEGHVHISQGRIVDVALRTVSIDLLEFEDDPYPL